MGGSQSVYRIKTTKIKIINRSNVDDDHGIFYSDPYLFSSFIVSKNLSLCLKNIIKKFDYEIEIQYNDKGIVDPVIIRDKTGTNFHLYCTNDKSAKNSNCKIFKLMYNDLVYKFPPRR